MSQRVNLAQLLEFKRQQRPITVLTCYDAHTAALLQQAGIDSILVGDSLAQVILGYDSTLPATMDMMIAITAAVRRGGPNVFLIGDMPFLSYQTSKADAIRNAGRFLTEAGCDAVKVEVDHRYVDLVADLAKANIPVIAHLGYRPQSAYQTATIVKGRQVEQAVDLVKDCLAMQQAGAVALLLECVAAEVAAEVSKRCEVPVISCGSGPGCDGQVIVLHDVMGLPGGSAPRFVKTYCQVAPMMLKAAQEYVADVAARRFPDNDHCYHMNAENIDAFRAAIKAL
ncbi:MAG: 3-methyl-2-oxobutanoate hydroxymethyltransferase [Sedimentisphaerales bacterium]|nr:3-methyl-2-oxobutanoate hydroxymethyltransferase [Sedimentisphaerales bacterium]